MGRICPRVSQQWRGYFTSQVYPPLVLELMALKPPFFVTVMSYQGPRLPHGVAPSTVFPTHGHQGVTPSISPLGYVFSWRRLILTTPSFGDCSSWAMSDHLIFHYLTCWWHTKRRQPIMYAAERHFHKRWLCCLLDHPPFSCPRHHIRWPDRYNQ